MARVLVSLSEIADALQALESFTLDGERYLDGEKLLDAVTFLTRGVDVSSREAPSAPAESPAERPARGLRERLATGEEIPGVVAVPPINSLERERARLAALPRGRCVCGHADHFDGKCPECGCSDYVDTTVRDPLEAAREAFDKGQPAPAWAVEAAAAAPEGIMLAVSMFEAGSDREPRLLISDRPPVE